MKNNVESIKLKHTDLVVSRLCMGGCPMGQYGWGEVFEDELVAAVKFAVENGINFFDTADTYGLGKSEETLAKGLENNRKDVVIQTKFGVRIENGNTFYDNSPEYIDIAINNSLKRLKTDYVDVYTIHYRDGKTPISVVIEKLIDLRKQGKIRFFGLSNVYDEDIDGLIPYKEYFVNCQDEYSLACRKNEKTLINLSKTLNLTPLSWGSLGQGVLTGKYTVDTIFSKNDRRSREIYSNFHGEKFIKNLQIVEKMKPIAQAHNVSLASVAIRFILDNLQDSVVLVGAKRVSQLEGSIESMGWSLTPDELNELKEISR